MATSVKKMSASSTPKKAENNNDWIPIKERKLWTMDQTHSLPYPMHIDTKEYLKTLLELEAHRHFLIHEYLGENYDTTRDLIREFKAAEVKERINQSNTISKLSPLVTLPPQKNNNVSLVAFGEAPGVFVSNYAYRYKKHRIYASTYIDGLSSLTKSQQDTWWELEARYANIKLHQMRPDGSAYGDISSLTDVFRILDDAFVDAKVFRREIICMWSDAGSSDLPPGQDLIFVNNMIQGGVTYGIPKIVVKCQHLLSYEQDNVIEFLHAIQGFCAQNAYAVTVRKPPGSSCVNNEVLFVAYKQNRAKQLITFNSTNCSLVEEVIHIYAKCSTAMESFFCADHRIEASRQAKWLHRLLARIQASIAKHKLERFNE